MKAWCTPCLVSGAATVGGVAVTQPSSALGSVCYRGDLPLSALALGGVCRRQNLVDRRRLALARWRGRGRQTLILRPLTCLPSPPGGGGANGSGLTGRHASRGARFDAGLSETRGRHADGAARAGRLVAKKDAWGERRGATEAGELAQLSCSRRARSQRRKRLTSRARAAPVLLAALLRQCSLQQARTWGRREDRRVSPAVRTTRAYSPLEGGAGWRG